MNSALSLTLSQREREKFTPRPLGEGKGERVGFKLLFIFSFLLLFLGSCTTKPVLPPEDSDPTTILPSGEDWYILTRPSAHPDLIMALAGVWLSDSPAIKSALTRTETTLLSGSFGKKEVIDLSQKNSKIVLPDFSACFQGDYPAFFVRNSLRKDDAWRKGEGKTYQGPGGLIVETEFKDLVLAVSGQERLELLQQGVLQPEVENRLPLKLREWWLSGNPALLIYLPSLSDFPLPEGVPAIPGNSQADLALIPAEDGKYALDLSIGFPDSRSARLWSLGLRFYLAARLGNSPVEEERQALGDISLNAEESTIRLTGWVMTPEGWGQFLSPYLKI